MKKILSIPIDWLLVVIPLIIVGTGIITIYTITYTQYQSALAIDQSVFVLLGIIAMTVVAFTDYRFWGSISGLLYAAGILLLIPLLSFIAPSLPFVPRVFGAYRWIDLGLFQIQPAEIFKFIAIVASSRFLAGHIGALGWRRVLSYAVFGGIPILLILIQPDLGTASVVFMIFLSVFLTAKPSAKTILTVALAILVAIIIGWFNLADYQRQRVETFLNPMADPQGEGYNVRQSLIAVGSGGLTGRGFGQGSQTVLNFLPVPHADFIFAGYAEATGFIGSITLLLLYVVMLYRIIGIARSSPDPLGQLISIGVATKVFFQVAVHVGMNIGLLPVTGIPLPLMSYGGTALIIDLAALGLVQSIAMRHRKTLFAL